jgi:hypothetical protein
MEICANCPNRNPNPDSGRIAVRVDEANVLLGNDGSVYYAFIDGNTAGCGHVDASMISEEYPKLAAKIESCSYAQQEKEPRQGLLGKLGLNKTVKVCPALASEMKVRSGKSVHRYFQENKFE